jgi:chaperonin GroES
MPEQARFLLEIIASENVATLLKDNIVDEIGRKVVDEYEIDKASRRDWDKKMEDAMDVALQVSKPKSFPWPKAANVKYPLLTVAAIQFAARAYPAIVNNASVAACKVVGRDDGIPVLDESGQMVPDPRSDPQAPVPLWQVPPGAKRDRGDRVARHMSWQLTDEMVEWEEDTDRLLHILPITGVVFRKLWFDKVKQRNCSQIVPPNELIINYKASNMRDAPRMTHEFPMYPNKIEERVRAGVFLEQDLGVPDGTDPDAPHDILEQHRLLDLDDDGYKEPYSVTVHKQTGKVLRILPRFSSEGVVYTGENVAKIVPHTYFVKYGFIPNPESAIYDLGFGMLLNPINQTVNSVLNQMLDAGTIQTAGGGFIGNGLRIKGGAVRFTPNEYKRLETSGQKIADSIYHMQHPGPSPVLFQLLGLLIDAGKEISSVQDVLMGDTGGNEQTATTTLALIEQGMKTFSAIFKRVHRALGVELGVIYDLNRRFLDPEGYFTVLDNTEAVAQQDYATGDFDIVPLSDPRMVTDMQKAGRADFLRGFIGDPFFDQMKIRGMILDAANIEKDDLLVQPPPPRDPEAEAKAMKIIGELRLDKEMQPVEMVERLARAMASLAQASAAEGAPELAALQEELEDVLTQFRGGGVPGVAGPPGDGGVPPVSA